jgi:hypothetical protein
MQEAAKLGASPGDAREIELVTDRERAILKWKNRRKTRAACNVIRSL